MQYFAISRLPLTSEPATLQADFCAVELDLENNDYHDTHDDTMPNILTGVVTKTGAMAKTITVTVR